MKIYQAVPNPYTTVNQYVVTLMEEIAKNHLEIHWGYGIEIFWSDEIFKYDIIHIQWPNMLLHAGKSSDDIDKRLNDLKRKNIIIVATCHNLEPHYCSDVNIVSTYKIVYSASDMIFHLGSYSKNLFEDRYSNAINVILPHHVYDTFYTLLPSKYDSCNKLNLNSSNKYIVCYGAFRDEEERILASKVGESYRETNVYVLAPSYDAERSGKILKRYKYLIKNKLHKIYRHIICNGYANYTIPNELTPYYYGASDLALIQRKKILNSGNVLLAFLMGKVVVGPNVGNVGLLLKETGNPTFDVDDDSSVLNAVKTGFDLAKENYGEKNRKYALDNFSTAIIAERLYNYYLSLNK